MHILSLHLSLLVVINPNDSNDLDKPGSHLIVRVAGVVGVQVQWPNRPYVNVRKYFPVTSATPATPATGSLE